jgi:hypothetical protein
MISWNAMFALKSWVKWSGYRRGMQPWVLFPLY